MKQALPRAGVFERMREGPGNGAATQRRAATVGPAVYAARMRAPFAVLGIRTAATVVTGIDYLPLT